MGNCIKPVDPLVASLPRGITVDGSPIKESGVPIIFVIGAPGSGKKTLCTKVAQKYGFHGIITSEILRSEVSKRTDRAFVLARLISQGRLVPSDILIELITVKMLDQLQDGKGFIVSGFPREKQQCKIFDREIRPPDLVLFLDVRNSVLSDRIMARSVKTTERMSISFDNIRIQIKEFKKQNKPVIKHYQNLLVVIDGEYDVMTVFKNICKVIDDVLFNFSKNSATTSADNS
ncbi:Adenylate kinase isoenzyme 1 [Habropoda laboriosa]|uniref:Adenylate kinase isoenzyme 1 n=2 Tax=Habropoda laboriosa TaxID=597456 RepID=A0A0L7QRD1_9HYME|nr:Adenylate kinase isoenzyme 1 [Habropoda laboriosa]